MAARISAALSALVFAMLMTNASATWWWGGHHGGSWGGWSSGGCSKWSWWRSCQHETPVVVHPTPEIVVVNPPTSTCARVDIPFHTQCTTASGGHCSRCLGRCCLDDGHCPTARCNDGHSDADFCYSNSPYYYKWAKYDRSNCLGNLGYSCSGGWVGGNCPSSLAHAKAVCVPFNYDCGKSTSWGSSWGSWGSWGASTTTKGCLGYIYCPNGGCGDWDAAPCIYQGHSKLTEQYNWHAIDYEICSCPLTHDIFG